MQTMLAMSWHNFNIDVKTMAAMSSAYALEAVEENSTLTSLDSILSHYKSGGIAMAGIYLSKKNDRNAMRNPGLFASEENYYYTRIFRLVKNGIMPKFITVAAQMVKYPENALYWGPYLLKTTNNVENLCKEFELVATNGRLSFKDIQFLVISDELKSLFDLAQLGNVDWKTLLNKLGDFGKDLSKEQIKDDMKHLGNVLASAGQQKLDNQLQVLTNIGQVFHTSTDSIWIMYDKFKDTYQRVKDGESVKNLLMDVIGTPDAAGVARLFKTDEYNITGYISNYLKELQDQYYTQRYYIYTEDSGTKEIAKYEPPCEAWWWDDPSSSDLGRKPEWAQNGYLELNGAKDDPNSHVYPSTQQTNDLKAQALSKAGWSSSMISSYEKEHPGHSLSVVYTLNHRDVADRYKTGWHHHYHYYCEFAYSVSIVDTWYIKQEVYEEIFDSQSMDKETFVNKLNAKLNGYNDNKDEKDSDQGVVYKLGTDTPRYYSMADERKMAGCNTVSFVASCSGGANLAEGSFNWKENSYQQGSTLTPASKTLAMSNAPATGDEEKQLLLKKKEYNAEINGLKWEISANDNKQQEILAQIKQAKLAGNTTLVNQLNKEYDALDEQQAQLKNQLTTAQNNLTAANNALNEYYNDLAENLDGDYRIPSNMAELQSMYQLQWQDDGEWVDGDAQYTFVRHAYCPSANANVTYTAVLKVARKTSWFLGIRIHRAILSVDFTLSGNSSSEEVVETMNLDMSKSEKERTEEVNKRLKELLEDMPDCSISVRYDYSNTVDTSDDESDDKIHLLWASDRLDIARDVELQLTQIYAQLVLLEHVMTYRQSLLDFFKNKILDVVSRSGRGTLASYCLQRWEDASLSAMKKTNGATTEKTNNNTDNNTSSEQQ